VFQTQGDQLSAALEVQKSSKADLERQHEQLKAFYHDQQNQLERLQDTIAAKDEEIVEFQAMRQILATAIGQLPGQRKHPRKSVHYAPSATRSPATRGQSRRLTDRHADSPLKAARVDVHGAATVPFADVSFESVSTQNGSTPKRAKPPKAFEVPAISQPRLSAGTTPKSAKMRFQRLPLRDISAIKGNRSPSRQRMSKKPSKLGFDEENIDIDDAGDLNELDFGSEIFTSTPFTSAGARGHADLGEDETVDE
jgi:Tfp pilus assembly protein FimV